MRHPLVAAAPEVSPTPPERRKIVRFQVPQSNLALNAAQDVSGFRAALNLDFAGLLRQTRGGSSTKLNITAATVVKASPGRVARVVVVAGGTSLGSVNDAASAAAAVPANQIASIGTVAGMVYDVDWLCQTGITVIPGDEQVLAVSYT